MLRGRKGPGIPIILGAGSVALLFAAHQASAELTTDYGLGYTNVFTNNVYRSETDKQQEGINMVTGLFSMKESSASTEFHLDTEVQGRQYMRNSYPNGALYGLDGGGTLVVLPKRFTLSAADLFTQAPVDPLQVLSPANRQNVNTASVGPNFYAYLTPIDVFDFGGRYENDYYQSSPTSNHRDTGYFQLKHSLSTRSQISLNYDPSRVYYNDPTLNPDYSRQDIYLGLHARPYETTYTLDVGHTVITPIGQPRLSGPLIRGAVQGQITSRTSLELAARREYGDAGRYALDVVSPLTNVPAPLVTSPSQLVGGGLYLGNYLDGRWLYRRLYGSDRVHLFGWRLNYVTEPLSQELRGGTFNVGYDYSDAWTASLFGGYVRTEYLSIPRTDHSLVGGPALRYRFTPHLALDVESIWDRQRSTTVGQSFVEWRSVISISYNTSPGSSEQNPFLSNNNLSYLLYR